MSRTQAGNGISAPPEIAFADVVKMIDTARQHAYQAVNTTLIELYWQVGAYISAKLAAAEWGDGVVDQLAHFLASNQPGLRGFTRSNLFRMRQFYDTYRDAPKVVPLARQLSGTHNLIIMDQSKRAEEREFYLRMAVQEEWSKRELERQFRVALFERTVLEAAKVSATLRQSHHDALGVFKDWLRAADAQPRRLLRAGQSRQSGRMHDARAGGDGGRPGRLARRHRVPAGAERRPGAAPAGHLAGAGAARSLSDLRNENAITRLK